MSVPQRKDRLAFDIPKHKSSVNINQGLSNTQLIKLIEVKNFNLYRHVALEKIDFFYQGGVDDWKVAASN